MDAEQQARQWGQIVGKVWRDDRFKQRLMTKPADVLKEHGLQVPPGVELRVVENTDQVLHLTIPAQRLGEELSDAELEGVAGGIVALEYLLVATIVGLSMIVGVSAIEGKSAPVPKPADRTPSKVSR